MGFRLLPRSLALLLSLPLVMSSCLNSSTSFCISTSWLLNPANASSNSSNSSAPVLLVDGVVAPDLNLTEGVRYTFTILSLPSTEHTFAFTSPDSDLVYDSGVEGSYPATSATTFTFVPDFAAARGVLRYVVASTSDPQALGATLRIACSSQLDIDGESLVGRFCVDKACRFNGQDLRDIVLPYNRTYVFQLEQGASLSLSQHWNRAVVPPGILGAHPALEFDTLSFTPSDMTVGGVRTLLHFECGLPPNTPPGIPPPGGAMCVSSDAHYCVEHKAAIGFVLNGAKDMTLVEGRDYTLQMLDVPISHPFVLTTSNSGGRLALDKMIPNTYPASDYQVISVKPDLTGGELYYQCGNHDGEGGEVSVLPKIDPAEQAAWEGLRARVGSTFSECGTVFSPCACDGITCEDAHVTQIDLSAANFFLVGNIDEGFADFSRLTELVLSGGRLSGPIPSKLQQLSNLRRLDLSGNQLTGSVPDWIGNLGNLTKLQLNSNKLTGCLPHSLTQLSLLRGLRLDGNLLTGHLNEEMASFLLNPRLYASIDRTVDLGNEFWCPLPASLRNVSDTGPRIECVNFSYSPSALTLVAHRSMSSPAHTLRTSSCTWFESLSPLPFGLELDNQTGMLSGTPAYSEGSSVVLVAAHSALGTSEAELIVAVRLAVQESNRSDILLAFLLVLLCVALMRLFVSYGSGKYDVSQTPPSLEQQMEACASLSLHRDKALALAELYWRDAQAGRRMGEIKTARDLALYRVLRSPRWSAVLWASTVLLLLERLFEPSTLATRLLAALLEHGVFAVQLFDLYLNIRCFSTRSLRWRSGLRLLLIGLMWVELCVSLVASVPRYLVALRPVLLIMRERRLREMLMGIVAALPSLFAVFLIIFVFLFAFSVIAFLLFLDTVDANATLFISVLDGFWNLFLFFLTPWNIPDRIESYMNRHPGVTIAFVIAFVLVMMLFWAKILGSVTAQPYRLYQAQEAWTASLKRESAERTVFALVWTFGSAQRVVHSNVSKGRSVNETEREGSEWSKESQSGGAMGAPSGSTLDPDESEGSACTELTSDAEPSQSALSDSSNAEEEEHLPGDVDPRGIHPPVPVITRRELQCFMMRRGIGRRHSESTIAMFAGLSDQKMDRLDVDEAEAEAEDIVDAASFATLLQIPARVQPRTVNRRLGFLFQTAALPVCVPRSGRLHWRRLEFVVWELLMNTVTCAYCIFIYVQCAVRRDMILTSIDGTDSFTGYGVFLAAFVLDIVLKTIALGGPCGFAKHMPFSELVIATTTAALVFQCAPGYTLWHRTLLAVGFCRAFVFILLFKVKASMAAKAARRTVPQVLCVLTNMVGLLYFFAVVGYEQYRHVLVAEPTDPILLATSWARHRKEVNFETFPSSLLALFFCMVAGRWEAALLATNDVLKSTTFNYCFFIGFQLLVGLVFYPVLAGFYVQFYQNAFDAVQKEEQEKKSAAPTSEGMQEKQGESEQAEVARDDRSELNISRRVIMRQREQLAQQKRTIAALRQRAMDQRVGLRAGLLGG